MELREIAARFEGKRIVVLGDLGVDCYVETRPSRLSREAAVMVLRYQKRRYLPGCAANTVMNLRLLGANVIPIGFVGEDEPGMSLLQSFKAVGVPDDGIVVAGDSIVKLRLMSGDPSRPQQQLVRVDMEPEGPFAENAMMELIARAGTAEDADGVVVSDYGYGAASPGLLRAVQAAAGDAHVSVDSRLNVTGFEDVDLLTPNEWEAAAAVGRPIKTEEDAREAASEIRMRSHANAVLLTRGNKGMILADGETHHLPIAGSREIVDVSGAGDTVVAAATLARAAGANFFNAARIANYAAGISVMKAGAVGVQLDELMEALPRG